MFCLLRDLQITDYNKGYYECLNELTEAPKQDFTEFKRFVEHLKSPPIYKRVFVLELHEEGEPQTSIIGTGSVFFEYKTIHNGCFKAHIEDVVIREKYRGLKLGQLLIEHLKQVGMKGSSYKIELTCAEDNMKFYKTCEFESEEYAMSLRIPNVKKVELGAVKFKRVNTRLELQEIIIESPLNTSVSINGDEQLVSFDEANNNVGPTVRQQFVVVSKEEDLSTELDSDDNVTPKGDTLNNERKPKDENESTGFSITKKVTNEQTMNSLRSHLI